MQTLAQYSCQYLKGIGPKNAKKLEKLSINNAQDVLFHLPLRYEDRTQITTISTLHRHDQHTAHLVLGKLIQVTIIRKPKPQLYCLIADDTGQLVLRFIHFNKYQQDNLKIGQRLLAYGDIRYTSMGCEMIHPEYRIFANDEPILLAKTLTPIYPTTEGLSQRSWMQCTDQVLALLTGSDLLEELLPKEVVESLQLPTLLDAITFLHRPDKNVSVSLLERGQHKAQHRLILEELLAHRLAMLRRRESYLKQDGIALKGSDAKVKAFLKILPFTLTPAQERVSQEIICDLKKAHPMMRLVQGDVGSGKTAVAALAAMYAVDNGTQVAMMAPTELLAEQHYRVIGSWCESLGITVALLKGGLNKRARQALLESLLLGKIDILIGTHALFQEDVTFKRLALMIIDEQHRFGVGQRLALKEKGMCHNQVPHQLIMTATPIPRTLAMSLYADLDYSVIDQLPAGRKPITTLALSNDKRDNVVERIIHLCDQGQQVYWVCPLIEESDMLQCQAAEKSYEELVQQLPQFKIALLHGRMKPKEKEVIMHDFKEGNIHILVATTVIEVGVDVPNATLMVIENAERLGLAQLHQLRGRIGRGSVSSYCILLYQAPLGKIARERIAMMRDSQDGFKIAEKDLALRGSGEILGTRQTGDMAFRIADLARDQHWLPDVQHIAAQLWRSSPDVCDKIMARWLGKREEFGGV